MLEEYMEKHGKTVQGERWAQVGVVLTSNMTLGGYVKAPKDPGSDLYEMMVIEPARNPQTGQFMADANGQPQMNVTWVEFHGSDVIALRYPPAEDIQKLVLEVAEAFPMPEGPGPNLSLV